MALPSRVPIAKIVLFSKPVRVPQPTYPDGVIAEAADPAPAGSIDEALIAALPMPEHWVIEVEIEGVPMSSALLEVVENAIERFDRWDLVRAERGDVMDGGMVETVVIGEEGWQGNGQAALHGKYDAQARVLKLDSGAEVDLTGSPVRSAR